MVQMNKTQIKPVDPAVEEVLASIRQIMSLDMDETEQGNADSEVISFPAQLKRSNRKRSAESSDVLTLTEMITTDGSVVSLSNKEAEMAAKDATAKPESENEKEETVEEKAAPLDLEDAQRDENDITVDNIEAKSISAEDIASLMSPEAVEKSAEAFSGLHKLNEDMQQKIQSDAFGAQTLDQLMREMLKPLLKEWLDSHLPSLVKWLVAEKIEQMIREKQGKS